jgi:hypothetical protein
VSRVGKLEDLLPEVGVAAIEMECFTFTLDENDPTLTWTWNVTLADYLVRQRPLPPGSDQPALDGLFPVASVEFLIERMLEPEERERALGPGFRLSQPLLCAPLRFTIGETEAEFGPLPIDGWHRLWRALQEGVPRLPYYCLTEEEEEFCLVKP